MKKFLLAVFLLLLVAACEAQSGGARTTRQASDNNALPIIAVSGSEIKVNGKNVWLGDTMTAWKQALGGAPTCYDEGMVVICVWHSMGLSLGTDHYDKTRVTYITLDLNIQPPELGERTASWPQAPFRGTLKLDGVAIHANTPFRDIRRLTPPARALRCGDSSCGNPIAAFSDGANIHMNLARRSENAPILSFSISCTKTALCTALIDHHNKQALIPNRREK